MSEHSHFAKLLEAADVLHTASGIICIIAGCGSCHFSCRLACSTVIISEGGNAVSGQPICNYSKRLVAENLLIPVLRTASGNHHHYGNLALLHIFISYREGKGSAKNSPLCPVLKCNFLTFIRERHFRGLRPFQFHLALLQHHCCGKPVLEECTFNLIPLQYAIYPQPQLFHLQLQGIPVYLHYHRNPLHPLGTHLAHRSTILLQNLKLHLYLLCTHRNLTVPVSQKPAGNTLPKQYTCLQQQQGYKQGYFSHFHNIPSGNFHL